MRIISGTFKGKKILIPKDKTTRPLKDLTKESIFNVINHSKKFKIKLDNAYILDLFSGVGSFGIECLSRGVKKVIFIENYPGVLPILRENLSSLKLIDNYEIINMDIYDYKFMSNLKYKFDVIFLDPPYKDKNFNKILLMLKNFKILKTSGIIILHRHKNEKDIFPNGFKIIEERKYGISKIIFITCSN